MFGCNNFIYISHKTICYLLPDSISSLTYYHLLFFRSLHFKPTNTSCVDGIWSYNHLFLNLEN